MVVDTNVEIVDCPYCFEHKNSFWVEENGSVAVRCSKCQFIYVNPRPIQSLIDTAVETGVHTAVAAGRTGIERRVGRKVKLYKKVFRVMFIDIWMQPKKISWLDVGAGYGEVVEAISSLAPAGSQIEGIEPMRPKAIHARARGLKVSERYLSDVTDKYDYISLINVFSHIPDFRSFLNDVKVHLNDNGELYIETGNTADLADYRDVPGELDLLHHIVFAGEKHILGYLSEAGFSLIEIKKVRIDGLVNCLKNIIKKILGRQIFLSLPYTSPYRSLRIRAKLQSSSSSL